MRASDITYIATDEGWLYLAVVVDLYSRLVVGWSMSEHMTANLVCDATRMALFRRGLVHAGQTGSMGCADEAVTVSCVCGGLQQGLAGAVESANGAAAEPLATGDAKRWRELTPRTKVRAVGKASQVRPDLAAHTSAVSRPMVGIWVKSTPSTRCMAIRSRPCKIHAAANSTNGTAAAGL